MAAVHLLCGADRSRVNALLLTAAFATSASLFRHISAISNLETLIAVATETQMNLPVNDQSSTVVLSHHIQR
jgi:hypothetical protein